MGNFEANDLVEQRSRRQLDIVMAVLDYKLRNNDERPFPIGLPHGLCIFTTREPQPSSLGSFNAGGVIHL